MDVLKRSDVYRDPEERIQSSQKLAVKRRSAWSTVAFASILLLLITLGAGAWAWMNWRDTVHQLEASQADLDIAQIQIADLREQLGVKVGGEKALQNLPVNDEQQIEAAALDFNNAHASPLKDAVVELTKLDGDQATASISDTVSGYKVILKKVNGTWVVVWTGQNQPSADVVERFDLRV